MKRSITNKSHVLRNVVRARTAQLVRAPVSQTSQPRSAVIPVSLPTRPPPKERLPLAGADVVGKPSRSGSGHADGGTRGQASEASVSARAVRGSRAPLRSGFAHHVGPGQRRPIPAPRVSARAVRVPRAPLRSGFAHRVGPGQRRPIPAPTCGGYGALGSTCGCAGCARSPLGWSWR